MADLQNDLHIPIHGLNLGNHISHESSKVATKSRRKCQFKLKFHHQALPAEYLDHYTASLNTTPSTASSNSTISSPSISTPSSSPQPSPIINHINLGANTLINSTSHCPTVRYTDLPYMGEMTLDTARPRRGRKPKKADICHLIYKNYGTTVVDEPLNLCLRDIRAAKTTIQSPPPVPAQVSLCKFKFTGGASPSLQEKKSFSMDQDGTFHLFDGGNRDYLQRRKKSRKSLAREKLEQTFKEKGFLIQTQQLESAQGATYCKFRQLRKFTRYLFRSWKHHLPGDVVAAEQAITAE